MLKNINYPGWELKFFDRAKNYRQYQFDLIKKYILGDVAEIGPGNGVCASYYINLSNKLDLYEPTYKLFKKLQKSFRHQKKVNIFNKEFKKNKKYNTILCLDVLEHIKDDHKQIENAHFSLKKHGFLIINVPAFQSLYSQFDKDVGHYRRYRKEDFKKIFQKLKIKNIHYIYYDSIGCLLSLISKIFITNYKNNFETKIKLWNSLMWFSKILDKIVFNYFGKSLMIIIQK
jgi:hypothetical protein